MNTVSQIKKKMEGILHPYLEKEGKILSKKRTIIRTGNPDYIEKKLNNENVYALSKFMDFSDVVNMLVYSKRITILKLFERFSACSDPDNRDTLMAVIVNRALIERIAYFNYITRQLHNHPLPESFERDYPEVIKDELFPKLVRALFATSLEFRDLQELDFKNHKLPKYEKRDGDLVDRKPLNILTPISQLEKKVPGVENSYAFLSEFVHPNVGDFETATVSLKTDSNEFGDLLLVRTLSAEGPDTGGNSGRMLNQCVDILMDALSHYTTLLPQSDQYMAKSQALCRQLLHDTMGEFNLKRWGLRKGSPCPCLSGLRIKECLVKHH